MLYENQTTKKAIENIFSTFRFNVENIDKLSNMFKEINTLNKGNENTRVKLIISANNTVKTNLLNTEFDVVNTTEFVNLFVEYLENFKQLDMHLYVDVLEIVFNTNITELKDYIKFELFCYMIYSDLFFNSLDLNKYFEYCKNDLEIMRDITDSINLTEINAELTELLAEFYMCEFVAENKGEYLKDLNMIKYLF